MSVGKLVAFVTETSGPGAITYGNVKFANKLMASGHRVDFVAIGDGPKIELVHVPGDVNCIGLGANGIRQAILPLRKYFAERLPDIIFASCPLQSFVTTLALRLVASRPRLILKMHSATGAFLARQHSLFDRRLLGPALRVVPPQGTQYVAVTNNAARDFERSVGLRAGTAATLYDPVLPSGNRGLKPLRHEWLDDPDHPLILSVGRLEQEKDFSLLLRAFANASAKRPEMRLMILGDGSERAMLEALTCELGIEKSVALPGFADPEPAYRAASLFVCSSAFEGLGNVIVEALAAGCPIVSTDCPVGPAEVLEGGKHGQLVPVGDANALAQAILRAPSLPYDKEAAARRAMDFHIANVWPAFAELAGVAA